MSETMKPKFAVVLYSKYSRNSMDVVERFNTPAMKDHLSNHLLCIDNPDIRKRVLKSDQFNIKRVPCILLVFPNGGVEKYEGEDAFNWVNSVVDELSVSTLDKENKAEDPPTSATTTTLGELLDEEFDITDETEETGGDIMSVAKQMEKSRTKDEEDQIKPPFGSVVSGPI